MRKGLSGGKKSGPPPKRGPNPQGITVKNVKKVLRKSVKKKINYFSLQDCLMVKVVLGFGVKEKAENHFNVV